MPLGPARMTRQGVWLVLVSDAVGQRQGQLCTVLRHQHCSRRQPIPGMSPWPLVVTDPSCCRAKDPDVAPGSSRGQDFTMASSGLRLFLSSPCSPVLPFFTVYTPFCFFLSICCQEGVILDMFCLPKPNSTSLGSFLGCALPTQALW